MGGGLMQLVAYGAQDIYLTGNPQITFFKVVYRRHTNFSMESIKQTFNGTADFGNDVSATISRNGDLVYRMYLEHAATFTAGNSDDNDQIGLVERYGDSLIKECEIEIGGQKIDKHTSMWNRVWSDLTQFNPSGHFGAEYNGGAIAAANSDGTLYQKMSGNGYGFNTSTYHNSNSDFGTTDGVFNGFDYTEGDAGTDAKIDIGRIFLPLNFWFCRNPGLALPLIALQYHEVKVKMTFETLANLGRYDGTAGDQFTDAAIPMVVGTGSGAVILTKEFDLWCDYIYLDTDERRRFAQVSHEYLIEQLQFSENTISTASSSIDLNFNHPVKELIWCMRNETAGATHGRCQAITDSTNQGDTTASPVSLDTMEGNWQLKLNGHDRFKERDSKYFTRTQVWEHHTGYGAIPTFGVAVSDLDTDEAVRMGSDAVAVYSFALKPEEHQPSGTCNFSRIDNAQLVGSALKVDANGGTATSIASSGNATTVKLTIFAVNYNVLRIMSGMGGLAYSN
jgi:hypothetical protein